MKVLITTSGVADKLAKIGSKTNSALLRLGYKPVISHIIDIYPDDTEFIITTGHLANQIEDFLSLAYPDKNFTFVKVDKYSGKGSSLAYSLLQARKHIQCPFIFHAGDTVVVEKPPYPKFNWIGGAKGISSSQYASFTVIGSHLDKIYEKGSINTDYLHIGLIGVNDYESFWQSLQKVYENDPESMQLADWHGVNSMLSTGKKFKSQIFTKWIDTGNVESLMEARKQMSSGHSVLDKDGESIFIYDKFVIKFFADINISRQRVERAKILGKLVPKILGSKDNFYKYAYVPGQLYADVANAHSFKDFLHWGKENLWKETKEVTDKDFKKVCHDFYHTKSLQRIDTYLTAHSIKDEPCIINDESIPSVKEMFEMIDFDWLCNGKQSHFHGDFILDNIIKTKDGYQLIDWRQNFGGLLRAGDAYYDFAKLNHNLTVNHAIINDNRFVVKVSSGRVSCDIMRRENLVECQRVLFEFLEDQGHDLCKVRLLTGLIWLNMSPLHHHPFDLFLFYFGKLQVWRSLYEKNKTEVVSKSTHT